jgi:hypothetical protein
MLACFWLGLLATGLVLLARLWPAPPPQLSSGDSGISANFPGRIKNASASCRRKPCVAGMTKLQIASLQVNRGSPRAAECLEWVEAV